MDRFKPGDEARGNFEEGCRRSVSPRWRNGSRPLHRRHGQENLALRARAPHSLADGRNWPGRCLIAREGLGRQRDSCSLGLVLLARTSETASSVCDAVLWPLLPCARGREAHAGVRFRRIGAVARWNHTMPSGEPTTASAATTAGRFLPPDAAELERSVGPKRRKQPSDRMASLLPRMSASRRQHHRMSGIPASPFC